MKVCFLTYNLDTSGGWGRFSDDLILGVQAQGVDVTILTEKGGGERSLPVLKRGASLAFSLPAIRTHLRQCDIIHALDGYPYGISAYLASVGLRQKLVITGVGTYAVAPLYDRRRSFLLKAAYQRANAVVSISSFTQSEILRRVSLKNASVITPGVILGHFYQEREVVRDPFILGVGALKYRKGYHISIPAFAQVRKEMPDLKYIIVGDQNDAPYFSLLKGLVKEYDLTERVVFLEKINDVELARLYRSARLFILTSVNHASHFEGFGLVFLEAAAAGLPVLGTSGNGIEDSVNNGINGYLVPQSDIPATAEAIRSILKNADLWKRLSAAGYDWAKENDQKKSVQKYIDLYSSLLTT